MCSHAELLRRRANLANVLAEVEATMKETDFQRQYERLHSLKVQLESQLAAIERELEEREV